MGATGILLGSLAAISDKGRPGALVDSDPLSQGPRISRTYYNFGNSTFDISPLQLTSSFYPVQDSQNNQGSHNYTYFINFAANIPASNLPGQAAIDCNLTGPGTGFPLQSSFPAPAYQYANPSIKAPDADKCHRLGGDTTVSAMNWGLYDSSNPSRGVWVQYTGGDKCPPTRTYARSLKIWLLCYDDAQNIPDDEVILESVQPPCQYEIFLKSAFGCPIQCPIQEGPTGQRQICGGHGVCDYDRTQGNSRCFCNPGFTGDDCSGTAGAAASGLSTAGGVLVGVSVFLALTIGFLAWLWFFKISRLRLDPTAYSALRAGPDGDLAGPAEKDTSIQ